MPTPHEELFVKMDKASKAYESHMNMRLFNPPLLPFGKHFRKFNASAVEANELKKDYYGCLVKVLGKKHGVAAGDIVNLSYLLDENYHDFQVLLGGRVRTMVARGIGNRVAFFVEGVKLGDNEKFSDLTFKVKKLTASF